MKFLGYIVMLALFSSARCAQHPAEKLARAHIELVGKRCGNTSTMPLDFAIAFDDLYSEHYTVTVDDYIVVSSRADFKKYLEETKKSGGIWRITDDVYVPDHNDTKNCKIRFRWWTEKNGVFDIRADVRSSDDGKYIELIEETSEEVFTSSEVS